MMGAISVWIKQIPNISMKILVNTLNMFLAGWIGIIVLPVMNQEILFLLILFAGNLMENLIAPICAGPEITLYGVMILKPLYLMTHMI